MPRMAPCSPLHPCLSMYLLVRTTALADETRHRWGRAFPTGKAASDVKPSLSTLEHTGERHIDCIGRNTHKIVSSNTVRNRSVSNQVSEQASEHDKPHVRVKTVMSVQGISASEQNCRQQSATSNVITRTATHCPLRGHTDSRPYCRQQSAAFQVKRGPTKKHVKNRFVTIYSEKSMRMEMDFCFEVFFDAQTRLVRRT